MRAHKVVQYIEDSSSQHDDTDNDSNYYPSSQASQESFLQMGIKRIESINKVEKRIKGKIETSREVKEILNTEVENQKWIEEVEERRKEKIKTSRDVKEIHHREVEVIDPMPEKRTCPVPDESDFENEDESEELERGIFWKNFHRKICNCKDFNDLSQLIYETEIPRISLQRKMRMGPQDQEDGIATFLLPDDITENLVPVKCTGDGNCMPRSLSHVCFGTERRHR